jgi:hypothetical protein
MQIPILNGIYTDEKADFRTSYPRNLVPIPKSQGISAGYLRPADGIVADVTGPGIDAGGINWDGIHYRVMGSKFVKIERSGAVVELGTVVPGGQAKFDYSFDRLAIVSGGNLYYWDGSVFTQVVDPDLGTVFDVVWIDGYFMLTDGEFLIVTELSDPTSIDPLKYGSSEVDPDPILAIKEIRKEIYAINRNTIEVFQNIGGTEFPFQRIEGAQMTKGCLGTNSVTVFQDALAFLGSGRNEPLAVYIGINGNVVKISTREVDQGLQEFTETELINTIVEARVDESNEFLYVHLPDRTLVYDAAASRAVNAPAWFLLTSGVEETGKYKARNMVWIYDRWYVADENKIGYFTDEASTHWGSKVTWDFSTTIIYNESNGGIFHELELVALTGRVALDVDPQIWTDYSRDGETWSQRKYINSGKRGERNKRLLWLSQGMMENWRIQRFGGDSDSFLSIARLEAQLEPLVF